MKRDSNMLLKGLASVLGLASLAAFVASHDNPFTEPKPDNCDDYHRGGIYSCKWSGTICNPVNPNRRLNVHCWVRCCYDEDGNLISTTWESTSNCASYGCQYANPAQCCDSSGSCTEAVEELKSNPASACPTTRPPSP